MTPGAPLPGRAALKTPRKRRSGTDRGLIHPGAVPQPFHQFRRDLSDGFQHPPMIGTPEAKVTRKIPPRFHP